MKALLLACALLIGCVGAPREAVSLSGGPSFQYNELRTHPGFQVLYHAVIAERAYVVVIDDNHSFFCRVDNECTFRNAEARNCLRPDSSCYLTSNP